MQKITSLKHSNIQQKGETYAIYEVVFERTGSQDLQKAINYISNAQEPLLLKL